MIVIGFLQYYEADRNYGGRRQDVLQGQIVEVEQDAEYVDEEDPVPVVVRGEFSLKALSL